MESHTSKIAVTFHQLDILVVPLLCRPCCVAIARPPGPAHTGVEKEGAAVAP
ncbi:hypothetical protein SAMN05216198_2768 [Halopseudomonas litoralis]|uniref:Uncharacterized protein n=1 Tax=Halopseudomonas litoralis TaxID=797277 RepID=A0A1H1V0N5_9GAMM|nr:hypothetical protein SAMN05216198_2768 [Halopseudomonas litoralis]